MQDIRTWMQTVLTTAYPVLLEPLNAPAPARPYLTVKLLTDLASCYPTIEREYIEADPEAETPAAVRYHAQLHREYTVSVNAYADNGDALLNRLKAFASLPQLSERPIMRDCGVIRDLSFLQDEKIKKRYQCDYTFAVSFTASADDTPVSSVTITGEAADIDASVTHERIR